MDKKMIGSSFTSLIMATRKKHHAGLERKCIHSLEQSRLSSRISRTGVAAQTPTSRYVGLAVWFGGESSPWV